MVGHPLKILKQWLTLAFSAASITEGIGTSAFPFEEIPVNVPLETDAIGP
jgi:hypothetical protein